MAIFDVFRRTQSSLVQQAVNHVLVMMDQGEDMFASATAMLLENEILEVDLKVLDGDINRREQEVRRVVLEHMSIAPQQDLVFCLKLVSIVHEAERIGDLAKSLAKVGGLAQARRLGPNVKPLRDLRDTILAMFQKTRNGFVADDTQIAQDMLMMHEALKNEVSAYLEALAQRTDLTPNESMVFALSARIMSRVSSHLANIVSTVVCPFDQLHRLPEYLAERQAA
ncbi:MAG: hypothetical protein RhofKO_20650 [Rhodothermales bacterium]